jgi:gag-polypeptide of LTR copia-type
MTDSEDKKTGSDTYHIAKLTETNYRSWSKQLWWIFAEKEMLDVIEGKEPEAPATTAPDAQRTEYEGKVREYRKKAMKARSMIGAAVSDSIMIYIEDLDDAKDMWRVLEEKYKPRTKVTLRQVLREFTTVRKTDDSMEHHLQRVQRLKRQVEEQGETVSNDTYCGILLNSVSEDEKYKVVVDILESQDELTPTTIINRLMEEERKILGGFGWQHKGGAADKYKL